MCYTVISVPSDARRAERLQMLMRCRCVIPMLRPCRRPLSGDRWLEARVVVGAQNRHREAPRGEKDTPEEDKEPLRRSERMKKRQEGQRGRKEEAQESSRITFTSVGEPPGAPNEPPRPPKRLPRSTQEYPKRAQESPTALSRPSSDRKRRFFKNRAAAWAGARFVKLGEASSRPKIDHKKPQEKKK